MNKYLFSVYFLIKTFLFARSEKTKTPVNIYFSVLISIISFFLYFYISHFYNRISVYAQALPNDIFPPYAIFAIILDLLTTIYVKYFVKINKGSYYQKELMRLLVTYLLFQVLVSNMGYFQITQMIAR